VKDLTSQLKEKMTEDEQKEAQYQQLLRDSEITKLEKSYLALGYGAELAKETATAQYDGDMEKVFANQETFKNELIKANDAKYLNNTPTAPAGAGSNTDGNQLDYSKEIAGALANNNMASAVNLINQQFNSNKEE
jgi:hypothetical protein